MTPAQTAVALRRPTKADFPGLSAVVDEWWGGRRMRARFPRLWFQHVRGTSLVAERADGRIVGFLIGFISPDDPTTAVAYLIATDPNHRRSGIGRTMYLRFFHDAAGRGAERVTAVAVPGDRIAVSFHRALGFRADDGPGTQQIDGVPARSDHDGEREDRVVLVRDLRDVRGVRDVGERLSRRATEDPPA